MTARQLIGAWLAALAMLGVAMAVLIHLAPHHSHPMEGVPIAVIGSSLMYHGFPRRGGGEDSLLGDGRRHVRLAANNSSEQRLLETAESALDDGATLLVIEVNRFIFSFKDNHPVNACDGWTAGFRNLVARGKQRVMDSSREVLGIRPNGGWSDEPEHPNLREKVEPALFELIYPLRLHQPYCRTRLEALTERARAKGVGIVFILPARSQLSYTYLGKAQHEEIEARAHRLADELGVELFAPGGPWPDSDFIDQAHVNEHGRARLMAEFRRWWRERHP